MLGIWYGGFLQNNILGCTNRVWDIPKGADETGFLLGRYKGAQLESTQRLANARKYQNDILDHGALCWILVRHRIDQPDYEFEPVVQPYELTNEVPKVIDICVKRIASSPVSMFGHRLVTTAQRFVQGIPGAVLAGQAKVDQIVACGSLGPCEALGSPLEVLVPVDLDRVKAIRVHSRRIEHDVVCCTVPVCDISLMHEPEALGKGYQVCLRLQIR